MRIFVFFKECNKPIEHFQIFTQRPGWKSKGKLYFTYHLRKAKVIANQDSRWAMYLSWHWPMNMICIKFHLSKLLTQRQHLWTEHFDELLLICMYLKRNFLQVWEGCNCQITTCKKEISVERRLGSKTYFANLVAALVC